MNKKEKLKTKEEIKFEGLIFVLNILFSFIPIDSYFSAYSR